MKLSTVILRYWSASELIKLLTCHILAREKCCSTLHLLAFSASRAMERRLTCRSHGSSQTVQYSRFQHFSRVPEQMDDEYQGATLF